MRKFVFIASLFATLAACTNESKKDGTENISTDVIDVPASASGTSSQSGSAPVFSAVEQSHDFGRITQGEKVSYSFVFKNTGGSDLIISNAQGSCGCTVPTYPKGPVKPGEEAKIDVVFDSKDKSGLVQKTVTLTTNCNPSSKTLAITATVIVPEED